MPTTFDFTYNITDPAEDSQQLNALGKGRSKVFIPRSFFFTEADLMLQSSNSGAYGPIDADTFRITTFFNLTDKKAYSVTSGQVLVLPQAGAANTAKVNVIIKPLKTIDIGIPIKYFVYRGIKKDMFVNGLNILEYSESANTPFMKKVWTDLKTFNNLTDPLPEIPATLFGYNVSEAGTTLIDKKFFNNHDETGDNTDRNYSLPIIEAGQYFGDFMDEGGFEIVLDNGTYYQEKPDTGFSLDLNYGRATNVVLDVATIAANTDISEKSYRENVQMFLDPAAFYGGHITDAENGEIKVASGTDFVKYSTRAEIYENIVSKFFNKNKLYLYIQTQRGRSYNFDDTLGASPLTFGVNGTVAPAAYATNGWPIIISEIEQTQEEDTTEERIITNRLTIQLKYKTTDKKLTIYNNFGNCANGEIEGSFLPYTALHEEDIATQEYTRQINYDLSNTYNLLSNNSLTVKSVSTFVYVNTYEEEVEYFNDFFGPIDLQPIIDPPAALSGNVFKKTVHTQNKIQNFSDSYSIFNQNVFFSGGVTTVTPPETPLDNRMRFYVLKQLDSNNNSNRELKLFSASGYGFFESIEEYNKYIYTSTDYYTWKGKILDPDLYQVVETLQLINFQLEGNVTNYMQLGLSEKEYNRVIYDSEIPDSNAFIPSYATNIYFHLSAVGTENKSYKKYKLGVKFDILTGVPIILYPSGINTVYLYTVDGYYFFTKEFSENHGYNVEFSDAGMVNFRTDYSYSNLNDPKRGYFGFDWLRLEDHYIEPIGMENYSAIKYEDSIVSGYDQKNKTEFPNKEKAFEALRKEYININTSPENGKVYYVPYLNIYPSDSVGTPPPPSSITLWGQFKNIQNIDKYELLYDPEYFSITHSKQFPLVQGQIPDYAYDNNSEYTVPFEITCIKEFNKDQQIIMKTYTNDGLQSSVGKVAGIIKVCKNSRQANRKQIKVVFVSCVTNRFGDINASQTGMLIDNEVAFMSKLSYQAFVYADVDNYATEPLTLNLKEDEKFRVGGTDSFLNELGVVQIENNLLQKYLRTKLYLQYGNKYKDYFKVFLFGIPGGSSNGGISGNADKIGTHSVSLYTRPFFTTLAHEYLHGLGLYHTHKEFDKNTLPHYNPSLPYDEITNHDNYYPVTGTDAKFVFHNYDGHALDDKLCSTRNIMSYNREYRECTWAWQWKIVQRNLENYDHKIED